MDASVLHGQIKALSDLHAQLQGLRSIPAGLLKRPITVNNDPFSGAPVHSLTADFEQLNALGELIRSDLVQNALLGAQERMQADSSHLDANYRRDSRKRRRPPSPESPKPYVPADRSRTSYFRPFDSAPLHPQDLVAYAREYNRTQETCRLHIWEKTRERREEKPRIVRFSIPDVLTVYLSLAYSGTDNDAVAVRMVTAFGPREKKAPHSQSDFGVYQQLSQEITKMMQAEERVGLPEMVDLLASYEGLFVDACAVCLRVVSLEGHAPPVVRVWKAGAREARHVTCMAE